MTRPGRRPCFFVGLHEVGDYTLLLTRALRELGFRVTHVLMENGSPLLRRSGRADRYIDLKKGRRYDADLAWNLARAISSSDIFVFNSGSSFWNPRVRQPPKLDDLRLLRRLGKTIVVVAMGSDLRSWPSMLLDLRAARLDQHARFIEQDIVPYLGAREELKRRKAARIERYAQHVFARPNSSQLLTKQYHLLWIPVDLREWQYELAPGPPLIVHAPSNAAMKGTRYVLEAVARLRDEGVRFDFELCENRDHAEVKSLLARSQIVVDQLLLPGYGLFALEAMAAGNAVIGSAVGGYNGFPEDLPVLTTTPESVYANLRMLIEEPEVRHRLTERGRGYVGRHHELMSVAARFLNDIGVAERLVETDARAFGGR
jgi:glycosyltransferase involved in cell wall biosynthesis